MFYLSNPVHNSYLTFLPAIDVVYTRNKRKESTDIDYKSTLTEHVATTNYVIDWDNVKVIEQEQKLRLQGINEAIYICANPQFNMPQGERHVLADVWESLLGQNIAAGTTAPATSP